MIRRLIMVIPDRFKTQELCNEAVEADPYTLRFIPDHLKTREMCNEVMRTMPEAFFLFQTVLRHKKCALKLLR